MDKKPPILVICETKLDPDLPIADLCLPDNYSVYRKDRSAGAGGLCFIVRNDISISLCSQNSKVKREVFAVDILLRGKTIRLIAVYWPPGNDDYGVSILEDIELFNSFTVECVLIGDFNLPKVKWSNYTCSNLLHKDFINGLRDWGFKQYITEPTRFNPPNILDLLWLKNRNLFISCQILAPIGGSDHATIHFLLAGTKKKAQPRPFKNFRAMNTVNISAFLSCNDWIKGFWATAHTGTSLLGSFTAYFHGCLQYLIDEFVPTSFVRDDNNYPNFLRKLEDRKQAAFKSWTRDFDYNMKFEFDRLSYLFDRSLKEHLMNKELNLISSASNRKFFSYVNSKLKSRFTFPTIVDLAGGEAVSDIEKAELFNNHFASVCTVDNGASPKFVDVSGGYLFTELKFQPDSVFRILHRLSDSMVCGPDGIPSSFYKTFSAELTMPLYHLYDFSLRTYHLYDFSLVFLNRGKKLM